MTRPVAIAVLAGCALAMNACGRERREPEQRDPVASAADTTLRVPRAGLTIGLPANAAFDRPKRGSTVLKASVGQSAVTVFAYARKEQLPRNQRELADARRRLSRAVQERDPGYRLIRSATGEVGGNRAVVLTGRQTFSRTRAQIRSIHVFDGSAEYVIEILAPEREFAAFDRRVRPMVERSLQVTGRVRGS